jgi:hypothetical protein
MDTRIDFYPTHQHGSYKLRPGRAFPFGSTLVPGGVNFSISSGHATACTLVLFEKGAPEPFVEIPFPDRGLRLGRRPPPGDAAGRPGDLRTAHAQFHRSPLGRRQAPRHLRRHRGEDPVPEGTGRELRRADADLRVRRVREQFANPLTGQMMRNYWGYSTVGFFAPKAGYAATGALGMEADELKNLVKAPAPQRHRSDPRCGVQPHRRGQRERADALLPRARQPAPSTC